MGKKGSIRDGAFLYYHLKYETNCMRNNIISCKV